MFYGLDSAKQEI